MDWMTRVLDKLQTGQLADATSDFECLVFVLLAASERLRVGQSVTCPVRELTSPRVGNPRVGVSASCPVTDTTGCQKNRFDMRFDNWLYRVYKHLTGCRTGLTTACVV